MEQDNQFILRVRGMAEVIDVTIRSQATDNGGAWWGINCLSLGADGHLAVITDPDAGLLAPDKRPPGTRRNGSQDGAFLGDGLGAGRVRGGAEFAMDFVLVGVRQQLVQEVVGSDEFADLIGGQKRWEAFLPAVVAALDFAFGLGRGRVKQFDAVEVEGLAELGEGKLSRPVLRGGSGGNAAPLPDRRRQNFHRKESSVCCPRCAFTV